MKRDRLDGNHMTKKSVRNFTKNVAIIIGAPFFLLLESQL
jgi:hypothetical protein